jgi:hypothetical protein
MTAVTRRHWLGFALTAPVSVVTFLSPSPLHAQPAGFDHSHAAWSALLRKHVRVVRGGPATQVAYAGFKTDRAALKAYLDSLSAVTPATFGGWAKAERQAFLINAYNAFTVELILTRYPDLKSIKDLGGTVRQPVEAEVDMHCLGDKVSLDDIEHTHAAQARPTTTTRGCTSRSTAPASAARRCAKRPIVAARLDAQMDEQTLRFMSDRTRNRFNAQRGRLELSKIFDWYGEDFRLGHRGIGSLPAFAARYADQLADASPDRERIRAGGVDIAHTDYDWALNDTR